MRRGSCLHISEPACTLNGKKVGPKAVHGEASLKVCDLKKASKVREASLEVVQATLKLEEASLKGCNTSPKVGEAFLEVVLATLKVEEASLKVVL